MSAPEAPPLVAVDARLIEASGIGTYLDNLLGRLVASGAEWRWLLLGDPGTLARFPWSGAEGVEVVAHRAAPYGLAQQLLPAAARRRAPDLLWVPHYNIPLAWRGRLLVTVHDLAHLALPEVFGRGVKRLYARLTFGAVRRHAGGVLFVSRFTRDEFHRLVGPPQGIEWKVPNGVDESWFEAAPAAAPEPPYFVFVGNVKPHKNLGRLLGGFARVADEIPHELVIVGRREGFITGDRGIERRAAELGERVRFTGPLPPAELRRTVAGAAALVLPSLYEGFGLPALEAMACGRPVLAARAGALPEVCGDAAIYCEPRNEETIADGLRRLVTDAVLVGRLTAAARERARGFRWDRAAEAVAGAIRQLLAAPARERREGRAG